MIRNVEKEMYSREFFDLLSSGLKKETEEKYKLRTNLTDKNFFQLCFALHKSKSNPAYSTCENLYIHRSPEEIMKVLQLIEYIGTDIREYLSENSSSEMLNEVYSVLKKNIEAQEHETVLDKLKKISEETKQITENGKNKKQTLLL